MIYIILGVLTYIFIDRFFNWKAQKLKQDSSNYKAIKREAEAEYKVLIFYRGVTGKDLKKFSKELENEYLLLSNKIQGLNQVFKETDRTELLIMLKEIRQAKKQLNEIKTKFSHENNSQ